MDNFIFSIPTRAYFGKEQIANLGVLTASGEDEAYEILRDRCSNPMI